MFITQTSTIIAQKAATITQNERKLAIISIEHVVPSRNDNVISLNEFRSSSPRYRVEDSTLYP